jgi:hypothetical protein
MLDFTPGRPLVMRGVMKELTGFAIVYNLVRTVMRHSAMLQHITVERSSFLDALQCSAHGAPGAR